MSKTTTLGLVPGQPALLKRDVKSIKGRKIGKYKYARYYSVERKGASSEIKGKLLLSKNIAFFID